MLSNTLIKILLVEYVAIMVACIIENNWVKCLYWLGASILNLSILLGMK